MIVADNGGREMYAIILGACLAALGYIGIQGVRANHRP